MPRRALVPIALAATLAACERARQPRGPAETVAAFVAAAEAATSDPSQRRAMYDLLSHRAQQSLGERAARASQVSGREFRPWEMLAPGRVRLRVQPDPTALTAREADDRAVVTARARVGGAADVPLVREEGVWRIDLALPPVEAPPPH